MTEEKKYYSLGRQEDWSGGWHRGTELAGGWLELSSAAPEEAVYVSGSFDSGESGTVWHRLKAELVTGEGALVRVKVCASDRREKVFADGLARNLDSFLEDRSVAWQEKEKLLLAADCWSGWYDQPSDVLLHAFKGRYLWIMIRLTSPHKTSCGVRKLRLYYPGSSFLRYLPETYQAECGKNSFMSRFVAVFQSLYLDGDEEIAKLPGRFHPEKADRKTLSLLGEWPNVEEELELLEPLPLSVSRWLVSHSLEIRRSWGTKDAMIRVLEQVWGKKPFILEEEGFGFTVALPWIGGDESREARRCAASKLIEAMKPIHTHCRLVELKQEIRLDCHSYLGVNSAAAGRKRPCLDGKTEMAELLLR